MNTMLQKIFKVIEHGNFREEPFVFTRANCLPQAWNSSPPDVPGKSTLCVVDELLAARAEARSISFPLSEFNCLTGRFLNDHHELEWVTTPPKEFMSESIGSGADINRRHSSNFRNEGYLTFKPFAMVTAHETPELFVLFCQGDDIRDFLKTVNDFECEIEIPAVPLSSANCRLLALPFIYLSGGLHKILLYPLKSGASSSHDGEMMAVLPMKMVIRIADILLTTGPWPRQRLTMQPVT